MVITITMKNVIPRGKTLYFRLAVPADCREAIGKREILQPLKTSDELEAAVGGGEGNAPPFFFAPRNPMSVISQVSYF
ncbi:hypothetical protein PDESU_00669 [Pontiella desulfatans]|uniref:DUF6538 domain-containing protein n=1 Tax=Pontiella desulfatans TaxID=2750659 RepID=A0A6C2TWZ8_PONDE|nr:hypothetical protein PDESU_00669 [Pontiella desulfatans]